MSEQKSLEKVMNLVLSGETLKNALDFIEFLRANEFNIEYNPNEHAEGKWTGAIGGVVGWSIGYMYVRSEENPQKHWIIWLNETEFNYDDSAEDDELKAFIWENANHCSRCNPNWEKCGSGEKAILGKKIENLCHSPMCFYMPDAKALEKLKKVMLKVKQTGKY